ncbi:MAG: hypothetical protein MUE54_05590 [Anaerolineae bacterium]|nr:hypothetical protein [Anaerolineae bacterium]
MLYLRPRTWIFVLFGLFLIFRMLATPVRGAGNHEAWYLWLTHDNAPMVGAIGDVFRAMRANAGEMLGLLREETSVPFMIYPTVLDIWRMVAGENIMVARWLSSLITLLALAVTLRGAHQLKLEGKWYDVIFVGLLFAYASATVGAESLIALWSACLLWTFIRYRKTSKRRYLFVMLIWVGLIIVTTPLWHVNVIISLFIPPLVLITLKLTHLKPDDTIHVAYNPVFAITITFLVCSLIGYLFLAVWVRQDWRDIIRITTFERELTQPIVILYPPHHPLAYYDRTERYAYGRGAVVNLGWRDFNEEELARIAESLNGGDDIWLVAFTGDADAEVISGYLGNYNRLFMGNISGIMPQRFMAR